MPQEGAFVATLYAPIMFPPAPVLVFTQDNHTSKAQGHMKCVFDGMIKAQDTVCMNLYKRIFPKWTYEPAILPPPVEIPKDIEDAMET